MIAGDWLATKPPEKNPNVEYWRRRAENAEKEVKRLRDRLEFALWLGSVVAMQKGK
jgi:hypothetical protein